MISHGGLYLLVIIYIKMVFVLIAQKSLKMQ